MFFALRFARFITPIKYEAFFRFLFFAPCFFCLRIHVFLLVFFSLFSTCFRSVLFPSFPVSPSPLLLLFSSCNFVKFLTIHRNQVSPLSLSFPLSLFSGVLLVPGFFSSSWGARGFFPSWAFSPFYLSFFPVFSVFHPFPVFPPFFPLSFAVL